MILVCIIVLFAVIIWSSCRENFEMASWKDSLKCLDLKDEQVKKLFDSVLDKKDIFQELEKEGYTKDQIHKCIFI